MKQVEVLLSSNESSIKYTLDVENNKFECAISKNVNGNSESNISEDGQLGSLENRREIALRIYHVIFAALRN